MADSPTTLTGGAFRQRYLSVPAAATYTSIPEATLRTRLSRGGAPPCIRIGRRVYFDRDDLDAWMQEHREEAA